MERLNKFIIAQTQNYQIALQEIKNGRKTSHWMWYIFPQILGLGESVMSQYYAITNLNEAEAYMKNDYLSSNMIEICTELLNLETDNAKHIFGYIDSIKLKSCMTLFDLVVPNAIFNSILNKFFNGERDKKTIEILKNKNDI